MLKKDELTNPNSCLNRAADDEMVFVLLARDVAAARTVQHWREQRVRLGKNQWGDAQMEEAMACAQKMAVQCANRPTPSAVAGETQPELGKICSECGQTIKPKFGPGDYSCVTCGFGMVKPCEHWKKMEAAEPAPAPPAETRFAEFDDEGHPFNIWWKKHGQFMLSGGGRRESIWAARGWIAREQLAHGVEVTGDSLHETPRAAPGGHVEGPGPVVWFHGTSKENAETILREGFKAGTWFSRNLQDAFVFGGPHVFFVGVHFAETPMDWQVCSSNHIPANRIQRYVILMEDVSLKERAENFNEASTLREIPGKVIEFPLPKGTSHSPGIVTLNLECSTFSISGTFTIPAAPESHSESGERFEDLPKREQEGILQGLSDVAAGRVRSLAEIESEMEIGDCGDAGKSEQNTPVVVSAPSVEMNLIRPPLSNEQSPIKSSPPSGAAPTCGKPAASLIPRWGMSWACALPDGHEGHCQPGGDCVAHGKYISDNDTGAPACPKCVADNYAEVTKLAVKLPATPAPLQGAEAFTDRASEIAMRLKNCSEIPAHRRLEIVDQTLKIAASLAVSGQSAQEFRAAHSNLLVDELMDAYATHREAQLRERVKELEKRLPAEMKDCIILFKECSKGHGWLTATNWVQHECPMCRAESAEARIRPLEAEKLK